MQIFPRVRFLPELANKAPTGTIGRATQSGWMNPEIFNEWFDRFVPQVQPTICSHNSHIWNNLELIRKARERDVTIVSLPSHCTHKFQPLEVSLFKSLNNYYNIEVEAWLRNHPDRSVSGLLMIILQHLILILPQSNGLSYF